MICKKDCMFFLQITCYLTFSLSWLSLKKKNIEKNKSIVLMIKARDFDPDSVTKKLTRSQIYYLRKMLLIKLISLVCLHV